MFVDFGTDTLNAESCPSAHISINIWPHLTGSDELCVALFPWDKWFKRVL